MLKETHKREKKTIKSKKMARLLHECRVLGSSKNIVNRYMVIVSQCY